MADNRELVRQYFAALDRLDHAASTAFFADDAIVHRSDAPEPIIGRSGMSQFGNRMRPKYSSFRTEIGDLIAEGDKVVARIRHFVHFESDWESPMGHVPAAGRDGSWAATAIFRFKGDKIAEEWVIRDDLDLLRQLGALPPPS